jgi:hypothetical protein
LALFRLGFRRGGIEQALQVPIAQTGDVELSSIDGFEEVVVLRIKWMQGPHGLPLPAHPPFHGGGEFFQRRTVVYGCQCGTIPIQDPLGNFGSAMDVGDRLPHGPPSQL